MKHWRRRLWVLAAAAAPAKIDDTLDQCERVVVRGRFGLDDPGEGKTFREPGGQLRLSKERVRQLLQRCLEKLGEVAKRFDTICAPQ